MSNATKLPEPTGEDWLRVGESVCSLLDSFATVHGLPKPSATWMPEARVPTEAELAEWDAVLPCVSAKMRNWANQEMADRIRMEAIDEEIRLEVMARRRVARALLIFVLAIAAGRLLGKSLEWMGWI